MLRAVGSSDNSSGGKTRRSGRGAGNGRGNGGGSSGANFGTVVSLLHLDGANNSTTITDVCGKTWTASGNAKLTTTLPAIGTASLSLDGTGDFVSAPDNADWNLSGDYTVEMWINPSDLTGTATIFGQQGGAGMAAPILLSRAGVGGSSVFAYSSSDGATFDILNGLTLGTGTYAINTWNHIALAREGNNYYAFQNGTLKFQTTAAGTPFNSTTNLCIGAAADGTAGFAGKIDEVRITKGAARYVGSFTVQSTEWPSTENQYWPYVVELLHFDGTNGSTTVTNNSGINNSWACQGNAALTTAQKKFGTASMNFDGTNSYVKTSSSGNYYVPGTGGFSIECWIRPTTIGGTNRCIFWAGGDGNFLNSHSLFLQSDGKLNFGVYDGTAGDTAVSTTTLSTNTWYFVQAIRETNGTLNLYIDGVLDKSTASTRSVGTPSYIQLGAYYGPTFRQAWYAGQIDDFRYTRKIGRAAVLPTTPFPDQ